MRNGEVFRTLILAPRGRDAVVAKSLLRDAALRADICIDIAELVQELHRDADTAIVTEESIHNADVRGLAAWIQNQPAWSDFPFVVLTEHGGGIEKNPRAASNWPSGWRTDSCLYMPTRWSMPRWKRTKSGL